MIELRVNEVAIPDALTFNYEEIKMQLAETLQRYETMVYTPEQMKDAKADKAALNKLKKALNDERIRREREYMAPFNDFKQKITELVALIDKPVTAIDKQVKACEEQKKSEKLEQIKRYFEGECDFPEWLSFEKIFVPVWLNATYSMKSVENDLKELQEKICNELSALAEMPAFGFEATEVYKHTLNLNAAINEGKRLADIQKRKEEAERLRKETEAAKIAAENERRIAAEAAAGFPADDLEQTVDDLQNERHDDIAAEPKQWISFRALLTVPQAKELRAFFEQRSIEFKAN